MKCLSFLLVLTFLTSCLEAPPRNNTLPPNILIADFSKADSPLTTAAQNYTTFAGSKSSIQSSFVEVDGIEALALDYHVGGTFTQEVFAGLSIIMNPSILSKDWTAIGFELRASGDIEEIDMVAVEGTFTNGMRKARCTVYAAYWIFCVAPITISGMFAHTMPPSETDHYQEIKLSFQNRLTTPNEGIILTRRVYLLATQEDIPQAIRLERIPVMIAQ